MIEGVRCILTLIKSLECNAFARVTRMAVHVVIYTKFDDD